MLYEPPHDPCLSEAQHRQLIEMEQHLRVSDPVLDNSLRTARPSPVISGPTRAGIIPFVATPLIILATVLLVVGAGAIIEAPIIILVTGLLGLAAGTLFALIAIIRAHLRIRHSALGD